MSDKGSQWLDSGPIKMIDFYNFSLVEEASDPDRKGHPFMFSVISDKLYFFLQNQIILGG